MPLHAMPGSRPREAAGRSPRHVPHVRNAPACGAAELTDNRAERSARPFVLGGRNRPLGNTPRGAEASCGIRSVVTTAGECGPGPMRYVEWLPGELPLAGDLGDPAVADRRLPWSEVVPDSVRIPGAEVASLREAQEEPIADVDPGALREDE